MTAAKSIPRHGPGHRGAIAGADARYSEELTERSTPKGERTMQRVPMSAEMVDQLDTLFWMRVEARRIGGGSGPLPTKEAISDEAVAYFLKRHAKGHDVLYGGAPRGEEARTMWIDSELIVRCRDLSERQGIPMRLLMRRAFADYIQYAVPPEWILFRNKLGEIARHVLQRWPSASSAPIRLPKLTARAAALGTRVPALPLKSSKTTKRPGVRSRTR